MAQTNRDQGLIILLGTALALAAAWYFWLSPTTQSITDATGKITELQTQKATLAERIAVIDATAQDIAASGDAQKLLALAAPSESGIDNLLVSLDTMAASSSVTLMSVQPQTAVGEEGGLSLTIGATGTFSAMQSFVAAMEKNVRPLTIVNLSLASGGDTEGSTQVTATFSLSTVQVSTAPTTDSTTGGAQ